METIARLEAATHEIQASGRVLSATNIKRIEQCLGILNELLSATRQFETTEVLMAADGTVGLVEAPPSPEPLIELTPGGVSGLAAE